MCSFKSQYLNTPVFSEDSFDDTPRYAPVEKIHRSRPRQDYRSFRESDKRRRA